MSLERKHGINKINYNVLAFPLANTTTQYNINSTS